MQYIFTKNFIKKIRDEIVKILISKNKLYANSSKNIVDRSPDMYACGIWLSYNKESDLVKCRKLIEDFNDFFNIENEKEFKKDHKVLKVISKDVLNKLKKYNDKDHVFFKLSGNDPFPYVTTDEYCPYPIMITVGKIFYTDLITIDVQIGILKKLK